MADEPEIEDDDVLELGEELKGEDGQEEAEEQAESQEAAPGEEDETVIELEDEPDPEPETPTIRQMREAIREKDRKIAELSKSAPPQKIDPGPKPTLESCEYDEEAFEAKLDKWKDDTAKAAQQEEQAQEHQKAQARDFQEKHANYKARAAALPVQGFKEAEDAVVAAMPMAMQEALVRYFPDAEKIVLALGKHPAQLERLATIANGDPVAGLLALKDFGSKVKMTVKRKTPAPDTALGGGSAPIVRKDTNKELERLEREADRTGDRTKVIKFKKELRQKEEAKK